MYEVVCFCVTCTQENISKCTHVHMYMCDSDCCVVIMYCMKTLTVAFIVKNEEKVLERALKCLTFADEIVVVDTGSTDSTVEIARRFTDNVYTAEWHDDFSEARNVAFSKATMQYVMWMDADDIVTASNAEKISEWKQSEEHPDTVMARYCTSFRGNVPSFYFFRERIFVNDGRAVWVNRVHEVVVPFGQVQYCDFEIWHKPIGSHGSRNLDIYTRAMERGEVFDARNTYYYARELFYNRKYRQSATWLKKFLRMQSWYADRLQATIMLADCYVLMKKHKLALDTLVSTLAVVPLSEACYKIGDIYVEKKQYSSALFWLECATRCVCLEGGFVNTDYSDFLPYMQLCVCHYHLGNVKKSYSYFRRAEKIYPHHPSVVYNRQFFANLKNKV